MTLKDLLLGGSGGLFALLTILQISPIKINPWSALARSIGRALIQGRIPVSSSPFRAGRGLSRRMRLWRGRLAC